MKEFQGGGQQHDGGLNPHRGYNMIPLMKQVKPTGSEEECNGWGT